ncbi:MAG: Crp/Fnr family transcriptional regulator [Symbiobacteriia bacterium]
MATRCRRPNRGAVDLERLIDELRCVPLFQALDDAGLRRLVTQSRHRHYGPGETLFHEGDPANTSFFLRAGTIKALAALEDGRENVLNILVAGDLFPHARFLEAEAYPVTTQALDDVDALLIPHATLAQLLGENGHFALRYADTLVEQIRDLQSRVRDLAGRDLHGRVAVALLRLMEKESCRYSDSCLLGHRRIHLTHQEIAGMVGASREAVSRVLSSLRSDGCVASGPDGLEVLDRDKLLRLV